MTPRWEAPVRVTAHALRRARSRLGLVDEQPIRAEIRLGLLAGRVAAVRPNWTRGSHRNGDAGRSLFVWDEDATRCWVVAVGGAGETVVLTVLHDRDLETRDSETQHVRGVRLPGPRRPPPPLP